MSTSRYFYEHHNTINHCKIPNFYAIIFWTWKQKWSDFERREGCLPWNDTIKILCPVADTRGARGDQPPTPPMSGCLYLLYSRRLLRGNGGEARAPYSPNVFSRSATDCVLLVCLKNWQRWVVSMTFVDAQFFLLHQIDNLTFLRRRSILKRPLKS